VPLPLVVIATAHVMPVFGDVGKVRKVAESTHHLDRPVLRQSVESGLKLAARGGLGHCLAFAGSDGEAIAHAENAIRLSPLDPDMALFLGGFAVAHYAAGRYAESAQCAEEALRLRPGFQGAQRMRCASLAQAGRIDEARAFLETVRREQPAISIEWIRASVPYQTPELLERYLDGMRKAGLNEA